MNMRIISQATIIFLTILIINGCKKDEQEIPQQEIEFVIDHSSGNTPINFFDVFQNPAGNSFKTSTLKYILSNFKLVKQDGTIELFPNIEVINEELDTTKTFKLKNVIDGNYTALRFSIGVDSVQNATLVNGGGDLDPSDGMVWTWNTGYIFLKHEGQFLDSAGIWQPFVYHLGTNSGYTEIEIPLQSFKMEGKLKTIRLNFDLIKAYGAVNTLDYTIWQNQQSVTTSDKPWILAIKANLKQSFSIRSIE